MKTSNLKLLFVLLLTFVWMQDVFANIVDEVERGTLLLKAENQQASVGDWQPALEMQTDVSMDINGLIASVTVVHTFKNPSDTWMEGMYVFPLPDDSAVNGMQMEVDGRKIIGEIKEKQQAKQIYQQAKREGKKAALLSQSRPNIFTSKVANIPPQDQIKVEIRYLQNVRLDNGIFELRFPLVIGPRFNAQPTISTESAPVSGFASDGTMSIDNIAADTEAPKVSIAVNLNPGFELATFDSVYHSMDKLQHGDTLQLSLTEQQTIANRDFVLNWQPKQTNQIQLAHFSEQVEGEDFHKVLIMPPQPSNDESQRLARELIFVVDTSGSMSGMSMQQAKRALVQSLDRLTYQDSFNIIEFDNDFTQFAAKSQRATADILEQARHWINGLSADGGTNMYPALKQALTSSNSAEQKVKQIIFLTDGAVNNEQQLIELIHNQLGQSRLFTIGIGSAPNSYFMSRAAKAGSGTFTFIGKPEEVESKLATLFEKLSRPAFTRFAITGSDGVEFELYPNPIPDLYYGEPLVLHFKSNGANGALTLSADNGHNKWQHKLHLGPAAQDKGVASLWARQKIASIMESKSRGVDEATVRNQVLPVALKHQLVSPYTSFVAVEQKVSRPQAEKLDSQRVKQAMPKGWSKQKVFGYPQTDLGTRGMLMLAWLLLALACVFCFGKVMRDE